MMQGDKKESLILIGFASSGKTVTGKKLAERLQWSFLDLDRLIEALFQDRYGKALNCRDIYKKYGEMQFRQWEHDALKHISNKEKLVLATGGGTPLQAENSQRLSQQGLVIYLKVTPEALLHRFQDKGVPAYLEKDPSIENISRICEQRNKVYEKLADIIIDTSTLDIEDVVSHVVHKVSQ